MSKSNVWDPKMHSKRKLGHGFVLPVSPVVPMGAQISGRGNLHLQVTPEGDYLTVSAQGSIPVSRMAIVMEALKHTETEPSYSGTNSTYYKLTVVPVDDSWCELRAHGGVKIMRVLIDPSMEISSSDEPAEAQQVHHHVDDNTTDDNADEDSEDEDEG
jgi:hypothetical protein